MLRDEHIKKLHLRYDDIMCKKRSCSFIKFKINYSFAYIHPLHQLLPWKNELPLQRSLRH